MLLDLLNALPAWVQRALFSAIALLAAYAAGRFLSHTLCGWLSAWTAKNAWKWATTVVDVLRRNIPTWMVLIGMLGAASFWPLSSGALTLATRVIYLAIGLSVTFAAAEITGSLILLYSTDPSQPAMPAASITQNIAKISVLLLGGLTILHVLGVPITPVLTALGVGGLAVALALQDTLSNLFSGFYLTMTRQIRVGDFVKLDSGQEGYVQDIGWRATIIRMLSNNMVVVPNNKLSQSLITNYYLPSRDLAVLVDIGVSYESDLDHVERVTCEVAGEVLRTVTGGVAEFEPFIRYHTFGEYSINFTVILRAKEFVDQYLLKHQFVKKLHVRYQQEGIVIPFPTRTIVSAQAE
jgi:small-conductance mechanosensitive channel